MDFPPCFFAPAVLLAVCILPAGTLLEALRAWSLIPADGQRSNLSPGAVQPGQRLELSKFQQPHVAGDGSGCLMCLGEDGISKGSIAASSLGLWPISMNLQLWRSKVGMGPRG